MFQTIITTFNQLLVKYGVRIFICLTICQLIINYLFYIDDFIAIPQFEHVDLWKYCQDVIALEGKKIWYNLFFITDVLWAACLLFLVHDVIASYMVTKEKKIHYKNTLLSFIFHKATYVLLFTATWAFDTIENLGYMIYQDDKFAPKYFELIIGIKIGLYALCGILWLLVLYKRQIKPIFTHTKLFPKSASISLLFLLLIIALLTQMEQGSSLVIALLSSPVNLFAVGIMLIILSIIFSHYPVYFLFYNFYRGNMPVNAWVRMTGLVSGGIIKYNDKIIVNESSGYNMADKSFVPYRYFIGALVFICFLYAMFFTFDKYIIHPGIGDKLLLLFIAVLLYLQSKKMDRTSPLFIKSYFLVYGCSWFAFFTAIFLSVYHGWYWTTFLAFVIFLMSRAYQRFFQTINKELYPNYNENKGLYNFLSVIHLWEYKLTGNIDAKLAFIKWTGIISFLVFVLSHIPVLGIKINPICIILCYIHIFYGFVIIILKNYLYYTSIHSTNFSKTAALIFRNIPIIMLLLFAGKKYWNTNCNELQYLNEYTFDTKETLDVETFIKNYNQLDTSGKKVNYYIAAWGGGLRATYFDLLVLDKKQRKTNDTFLNNVVAMSGVSGGALGLDLFFAVKKENKGKGDIVSDIYDKIGQANFASTDLAYLLGRDRLPFNKWLSRDRSIVGMQNYWALITSRQTPFNATPYQTYWKQGFNTMGYFPVLLTNTTKTSGNYGIACSAYMDPKKFDDIFKGATNILSLNKANKSLSFFEAMSTSERFPLFSATATISGQGHYIDGGYFDNSGLTSLMLLRHYIKRNSLIKGQSDSLIILGNSKRNFIQKILVESLPRIDIKLKGESDYGAIFKGILTTDRLGNLLTDRYGNFTNDGVDSIKAKRICVPFYLHYGDFVSELGGEPMDSKAISLIRKLISDSNKIIDGAKKEYILKHANEIKYNRPYDEKWDFASPTLSRYLSMPTVNYYKAMVAYHKGLDF